MIQQGTPEDAFEPQTPHGDESTSLQQNKPVTKHSKDSSTARQSQMAFATDIAQGLINEVRKLQQALQEKDRLIMDLEISKADSEKDNELTQKQLRQKNSIEDKLKEDNWNLEVANQDLQSNLSDLSQTVTKLNADHSKALKQLRAALEQVEIFKAQQEKATSIIDALKARHDHEQQVLRRNNGTLQRDMVQLKKRMDEVNTELKICKSKLAIRSTVSSNNIQQLLRGNNDNEHNDGDGTDSDRLESSGTDGDTLALETATSNTTANTQRALELETLKQSLGHAHRMISNLRNNLQKEKVEKIELKKVLADTQDSLDQLEKGAMQNETGRGSLKKNAVVNKIKVVRKRGGVARKGLSGTNTTNGTYLGEDQSNSLAIHTTLDRGDYDDDNGQLLEDHDDLDSADDNVSMDDSNSLQHDSADEDDLHRLDLSPIQQGQSLDMELQLGGFNSSFKPLSSELVEETLDKRQYSDKGVNTCSDLASTLSFGQQTTSHIRSSACIINGDDTTDVNSNSGNDGVKTEYTVINSVSTPSKSLSNVSSSDNMASSQPVLDLKRSPIPSSAGITKQLQQEEQQPTLYNEDAFDNATQSLGGSITPMPGSPSLNQQNLHSLDIVIGNTASLNKPENDISITATDPEEDGDHNPLFVTTTSIPAITDSTTDNKHTTAEAPQDADSTVTWIINSDASDKHLTHASDNSQKPTLIPLSNDDIMHAGEVININQSLYTPSVTQQSNPPLLETNEHHENTALSSLSDKEQPGLDLFNATTAIEYPTRDANSLTDSALITTIDVDELKQVTILDKNTLSDNQDNSVKDNKVVVDTDNKPNHQQNAALDLHADKIDDVDRTTPIPEENSQTFNSTLRPDSVTATTHTTTDSDDGNNTIADININSNSLMMDTLDMMSREEADALIKAGIADALAKERLEAATRRQELDDNFITRSEAEAMAKEQTERAVKKERDRASTMLTKAQADSLARSYAEQTLQGDQQRRQSQEHTTSTYPASSFLARAQAAASNKASGSSRRASQTSVVPSPKPSTSTSSTATVSSSSSSSSRLGKLSGFMNIQPSVSTPAKSNPLRPSASMSSLRRTTTMSSSISHHQQPYRPSQQKSQPQRQDDLLQPPSALSYGSVRITETSTYSKHPSTGSLKQQHLKQPSIQSLSSARSGMAPSLFSMGDLAKQGANGDLISAITQTMIGEWMWKHTRKHVGGGISVNKHKRFFWVHPYTRTLYWSTHEPGVNADESKAKSAFIESISSIPSNDTMGASPLSLLIKTAKRDLKLTAPNLERHEIWRMSLSYLLVPPGEDSAMEDVVQVDPYHETTTSAGSCLSRTLSSTTDVTTDTTIPTSQQSQPSDQLHPSTTINGNNTDNTTNDVTYARQGADDHDMSTSVSP